MKFSYQLETSFQLVTNAFFKPTLYYFCNAIQTSITVK